MRLLHEGPDIQVLLGEIRAQHGASAKIVKAERVRTGGIAGFFAKQHFEVTLDVAEEDAAGGTSFVKPKTSMTQISGATARPAGSLPTQRTASTQAASPSTSALDALIAAADEHDVAAGGGDAAVVDPPLRTNELIYQAPGADTPSDAFSTVLAKVTQWEEAAAQRQEPPVAPHQEEELLFDPQLIAGLSQAAMGRSWKALDAPSTLGQRTPTPEPAVTTPQPAAAEPAPAELSAPAPVLPEVDLSAPRPWEPHVLAAEELSAARIVRRPEPAQPEPEPESVLPTPRAAEPVVAPPAPEPVVTATATAPKPTAASTDELPAPRTRRERRERMAARTENSPVLNRLAELGLPQKFLSTLPADPTTADLTAALSGLPRASSSRPEEGEVIAILVEPGEADAAGSRISRRWRMDRASVAGGSGAVKLSGDKQAARLAATARSNGEAQLMVLDAELNGFDAEWAGDVLNAAKPDRVLAVVDATRKPHDIDAWLTAITPMVDAILLVNTSSTATPAAVLSLGIPVSEVDGRPGTAAEWAGLLMSRVFEGAE